MADKETVNLLQAWGFDDNLVQHFQEQQIDITLLKCLTQDLIKELIPNIGLRMRFKMKWEKHFSALLDEEQAHCSFDSTNNATDSTNNATDSTNNALSSESEEGRTNPHASKRQKYYLGKRMHNKINRRTVREILQESQQGRLILKNYTQSKILSKYSRNVLVEILVSHLMNNVKGQISRHDFLQVAQDIVETFPSEDINIYYIAPILKKDSPNLKSVCIRGKLIEKYRNKARQSKRLFDPNTAGNSSDNESETFIDEVLETSIKWLETNQEPWNVVQSHWKATFAFRSNDIREGNKKTISEIFEKWPILNHPLSWSLLVEDFTNLKLCAKEDAINLWPQFFQHLQTICPLNKTKILRVQELLEVLQNDISDECKAIAQLCALSYMIPPKGRVKTKKKYWKPSMTECEESLVVHVKIAGDILKVQQERIDTMFKLNLTLQPYIIVVGSSLTTISSYFVSVNKVLYSVPSALKAIDTCFKIFHVLNAEYPGASNHIWVLIQRALYEITTRYDTIPSYILEILSTLKNKDDS